MTLEEYCANTNNIQEDVLRLRIENESLQKEIKDLEQKLEQAEKDLTDYQFNYPSIKELEKENAELKKANKKLFGRFYKKGVKDYCEKEKQLAQAKGLLRAWFQYCIDTKGRTPLQLETAQFLKEAEE